MSNETYIGHRYVPQVEGEWSNNKAYEELSIVLYEGNSYTSKQKVPEGVDIKNETFWVLSGNYNAQMEQLRQDTTAQLAQKEYLVPTPSGADDTDIIRNALELAMSTGGKVVFPKNETYIYKGNAPVTNGTTDYFEVEGNNSTIVLQGKSSGLWLEFDVGSKKCIVDIHGINITGGSNGVFYDEKNPSIFGIRVDGFHSIKLHKNTITDLYATGGISLYHGNHALVTQNKIKNVWGLNPTLDSGGSMDEYGDGIYSSNIGKFEVSQNDIFNDVLSTPETHHYGRCGIVSEFNNGHTEIHQNNVSGYDRDVHVELTKGKANIHDNKLTGSPTPICIWNNNNHQVKIEDNYISNEGSSATKKGSLYTSGMLLFLGINQAGKPVIKGNTIKIVADGIMPEYMIHIQEDYLFIENNTFIDDTKGTSVYISGTNSTKRLKNPIINKNTFKIASFKTFDVEKIVLTKNTIDTNTIQLSSYFTGFDNNAFYRDGEFQEFKGLCEGNSIFNSGGLISDAVFSNFFGDILNNTFIDWGDGSYSGVIKNFTTNTKTSFGECSNNKFIRNSENGSSRIASYNDYRGYYTKQKNMFVDNVSPSSSANIIFIGNTKTDYNNITLTGTAPPTTLNWLKGDVIKNSNLSGGGYIGWVCVSGGTPGTWKGFGMIES